MVRGTLGAIPANEADLKHRVFRSRAKGKMARLPHGPNVRQNPDGSLKYQPSNRGGKPRSVMAGGLAYGEIENYDGADRTITGTSVFDPVLCELIYRWFCPQGGRILDPFAGGSVRGIVAGYLGYEYVGIELRPEQVEANQGQLGILEKPVAAEASTENVKITISSKWANHLFNCTPEHIIEHCHGRCCEGSDKILISLLLGEVAAQEKAGHKTESGLLLPDPQTGKCPHKLPNGLCAAHGTALKPFGCVASPFTLNAGNTLIIRNRYSNMKCHGQGSPAYETFKASLNLILGYDQADSVCKELAAGSGDIEAEITREIYNSIRYLDGLKHISIPTSGQKAPRWIVGDSINVHKLAQGEYDLIFSCPPYYDLESYSDLPGELSALVTYEEFIKAYRHIVQCSVAMLRQDRFACFVVGDIRDKAGFYRNLVSDTIAAFRDVGALLYNEAILVTAIGSLPIRINIQFQAFRKLGKTHQNVLIFYKGDPKQIRSFGEVEVGEIEEKENAE